MLTVAVLGRVRAERDGVPAAVPDGLTAALLVRLALDAGHPVRAERLVADLWPAAPDTRPNTVQAKVSQLRRALGDPGAVTGGPAGYTLLADRVDAAEALRLAEAGATQLAAGDATAAAATCRAGLALFEPEILVGAGDWAVPHRTRLEEARLRLAEDGLAARLALGAAGELTGELEALVAAHPLRERLWELLVTALYRAGRPADALAAHRRVTRMLADELGVDPGPGLAALERRVLVHDPALAAPAVTPAARASGLAAPASVGDAGGDGSAVPPTARGPAAVPPGGLGPGSAARAGTVPRPSTPLIGRDADVAAVRAALAAHRLVTITGPAGVGKTRLAVEVAPGGWLVRLDGVRHDAEVPGTVAAAVPGLDPAAVPAGLRGADLLLVLDNCEHLVDAVGALVTAVLAAAPAVRVLATSQRPLGVDGEHVHPLAPLRESDAVALFVERASARAPSFAASPGAETARLCRALDGLPLAIELAAARTRILSVAEIAARLGDRFALLADPTSTRPERARTLAAALSWSYDLLFPDDQRGLWALAAFPAGATLEALEHVLPALDVPAAAALDVVERLVDRSLVTVDPGASATRYRLLDSVRFFAAARATEAGVADAAADALVDWVVRLAGEVSPAVRGADAGGIGQAAAVAATAAERATIDAALDRAHGSAAALRIAVGFGWAWVLLDDTAAPRRLRAARTEAAPIELRVRGLQLESWLEAMSGDLRAARSALDDAAAPAPDDPVTRWHGGFVLFQEGRHAEARDDLLLCRNVFASSGERWYEAASLLLAAFAHLGLGEPGPARAACEEAIELLAPLGDGWGLQHAQAALGRIAQAQGRSADAVRHHESAADAAERLGFPGAAALHLSHLGRARAEMGDPAAAPTLRAAADRADQAGDLRLLATIRVALAEVVLAAGDRAEAVTLLSAADRWFRAAGGGDGAAEASDLLATLRSTTSRCEPSGRPATG